MKALTKPATATLDYQDIVKNDNISVVYISTTPESNHYPIARDCLRAGKNVLLEKPISLELWEADELITLAKRNNLKFTIGYSQRFNPKIAFAKKKIDDGTLGKVVSVLVSRHITRTLGTKIGKRVRLSPVVMESTHDLDFVFWLLEPAKPVRVYSQGAFGFMQPINGSHDIMFTTVTMDNGVVVMIGGGWNLPPSYPNYCSTWIEITGTDGALILDDTARDHWLNTDIGRPAVPDVDHAGRAGRRGVRRRHGPGDAALPRSLHPQHAGDGHAGKRARGDGGLHRGRPVGRPQRAGRPAADQRDHRRGGGFQGEVPDRRQRGGEVMRTQAKDIGLAIIGGGRVGLFRGEVANRHPAVKWIGLAEKNPNRAGEVAPRDRAPTSSPTATSSCSSGRRSPAPSSRPTSTCTSIRSWSRSSAAFRC